MKLKDRTEALDAALDIIAFEGLDKLSMQTLAERLGMNKSSFYHWFRSKDEIIDGIFREGHRRLMSRGFRLSLDGSLEEVLGKAALTMEPYRPESLLSNLVADILREAAAEVLGKPADMGLVNMGGLRSTLTAGDITMEDAYEILPFENALCVLTVKGSTLRQLFENIAYRLGEGVSGVSLQVSKDRKLLGATVGGKPVEEDKLYTVATVDYLAEGNDGMDALPQAESKVCPPGATLRSLFIDYVKRQAEAGKAVTSRMEGRIVVRE